MTTKSIVKILKAFSRYLNYINNHGQDEVIDTIKENSSSLIITMRGHMGETYDLEVYVAEENGELCIKSTSTGISIFDYGTDLLCDITEKQLEYIKFGG